ncbi:hypothetical protein Pmar_PMAR007472 [Perkinsus marinus ATCC 50983]|uniref:Uncharacterized protein n=1 Tax=Perkinsus marinus (strain ATCC 50983 / TXsc) TaxID=423536 RepID=C5M045_PERM5|nr:hypothetical protein Pmar_PMAR007472 [Perkinsus marinus ATCC 50983]EEQ97623.1 hypothetical protein Pmar_PMAR007472 [Perkinsus marinus ATCC 50983]|eukprot:XP_002764906.1 hypothetical protein Pmar_PMAR007472 [Perkinsus marinus ATCC 50983]
MLTRAVDNAKKEKNLFEFGVRDGRVEALLNHMFEKNQKVDMDDEWDEVKVLQ